MLEGCWISAERQNGFFIYFICSCIAIHYDLFTIDVLYDLRPFSSRYNLFIQPIQCRSLLEHTTRELKPLDMGFYPPTVMVNFCWIWHSFIHPSLFCLFSILGSKLCV